MCRSTWLHNQLVMHLVMHGFMLYLLLTTLITCAATAAQVVLWPLQQFSGLKGGLSLLQLHVGDVPLHQKQVNLLQPRQASSKLKPCTEDTNRPAFERLKHERLEVGEVRGDATGVPASGVSCFRVQASNASMHQQKMTGCAGHSLHCDVRCCSDNDHCTS